MISKKIREKQRGAFISYWELRLNEEKQQQKVPDKERLYVLELYLQELCVFDYYYISYILRTLVFIWFNTDMIFRAQ